MMYFNIIKNILFPIFHEHKNLKLNQFNYIPKVAIFRVLHDEILEFFLSYDPNEVKQKMFY